MSVGLQPRYRSLDKVPVEPGMVSEASLGGDEAGLQDTALHFNMAWFLLS